MKETASIKRITLAIIGLLLRGTVADLFLVFGLSSFVPVVNVVAIALFVVGSIDLLFRETKFVILSLLLFGVLWYISTELHPENLQYVKETAMMFFVYTLPFCWIGYYCFKQGLYLDLFLPVARIKLLLALVVQLLIMSNLGQDIYSGDYMTAANSLIVGLMATNYLYIRDRKVLDLLLIILGTIVILLAGSRSSFVAIVFFWFMYLILYTWKKSIRYAMIVLTTIVLIIGADALVGIFSNIASSVGYSTHITDALSGEGIFVDEIRSDLYAGFLGMIALSPWGYGIMGDRYISYAYNLFWKPIYPHNIFLEILVNFGYVIGGIVILVLLYFLFRGLLSSKSKKYKMCVLVLVSSSFIKLLFSSSFWIDQMFFMLLGVLIAGPFLNRHEDIIV